MTGLPPTNAAFYRKQADEVEAAAKAIRFEHERQAMLKIAAQWRALAVEAERRERGYF